MFKMIKCRPRLVRDSAMCRQSEVLSQISRPSEGRPSGVFPYQWYLDFWHQMIFKVTIMSHYLFYQITFSMASWIVCYGFMITCSIMAVGSE